MQACGVLGSHEELEHSQLVEQRFAETVTCIRWLRRTVSIHPSIHVHLSNIKRSGCNIATAHLLSRHVPRLPISHPPEMSRQALGDALIQSVKDGSFPQSEDVASAPLTSAVVPDLLQALKKSQEEYKACLYFAPKNGQQLTFCQSEIRGIASKTTPNVDQWIKDARKLQADVEQSQTTAQEIAQQAESKAQYTAKIQDAASRASFLYSEIAYSTKLKQTLEELQKVRGLLEEVQTLTELGPTKALQKLEEVQQIIQRSEWLQSTRAGTELALKAKQLRKANIQQLGYDWSKMVRVVGEHEDPTYRSCHFYGN